MTKEIEATIATLNRTLVSFCDQLQSSVEALKQSVDRRPIPLDSASSSFIQRLNRRVSSTSGNLDLLESMSFGTVSFEELLGHCNEVLKKNDGDIVEIEERLKSFGYLPSEFDVDGECKVGCESTSYELDSLIQDKKDGQQEISSFSAVKSFEEDPLLDDHMSLKSLGISEVSLASIASEANGEIDGTKLSPSPVRRNVEDKVCNLWGSEHYSTVNSAIDKGSKLAALGNCDAVASLEGLIALMVDKSVLHDMALTEDDSKLERNSKSVQISVEDYECLPFYMKSLASWEDLHIAVEKINSSLNKKDDDYFSPDEITSLDLGPKTRSFLLQLVRMNRLVVETINGSISYRVL